MNWKATHYNGRTFWSGAVNLADGQIEEVHTFEEAVNADFHPCFYFSETAEEKLDSGEWCFFWIDGNGVQFDPLDGIPHEKERILRDQIEEQINLGFSIEKEIVMKRYQDEAVEAFKSFTDEVIKWDDFDKRAWLKGLADHFSIAVNSYSLLESEFAKSLMEANKTGFALIAKKWLVYISQTDSVDLRNREAQEFARKIVANVDLNVTICPIDGREIYTSDYLIKQLSVMHRTLQQVFTTVCIKAIAPQYPACKLFQSFSRFSMI